MITGEDIYKGVNNSSGYKSSCDPLIDMIKALGENITIAEIGVCKGMGLWKTLTECSNVSTAYGIDTWWTYGNDPYTKGLDDLNIAMQVLNPFTDRVTLVIQDSAVASKMFPDEYFDYIFIDGDHSEAGCSADLKAWYPKIKESGLFAGHDYKAGGQGVISAVDDFAKTKNRVVEKPGGWVWYFSQEISK